jgi:hypothetical protein
VIGTCRSISRAVKAQPIGGSEIRKGTEGWDRWLAPAIVVLGSMVLMVIGGLDALVPERSNSHEYADA